MALGKWVVVIFYLKQPTQGDINTAPVGEYQGAGGCKPT